MKNKSMFDLNNHEEVALLVDLENERSRINYTRAQCAVSNRRRKLRHYMFALKK